MLLARFAARHPYVYTLCTGLPYIAFVEVLPKPFAYGAMVVWTMYRCWICRPAMRYQRNDAIRCGARYGAE